MAYPRRRYATGMVGEPTPLQFLRGTITPESAQRLFATILEIVGKLNGQLSLGTILDAGQLGNLDGQWRIITSPAVADTEFVVAHGLGRVPTFVYHNADSACIVYRSRFGAWTKDHLYLKCNQPSVELTLQIV